MSEKNKNPVFTIGHSNRSLDELIDILKHHGIELLVDVRHFPGSGRNPQFNKEVLEEKLRDSGMKYIWIKELGGFRVGGYENYMKTEDFQEAMQQLIGKAEKKVIGIMCAELLWFKCHRRYIASTLEEKDWKVFHIYDENKTEAHRNPGSHGKQYTLF